MGTCTMKAPLIIGSLVAVAVLVWLFHSLSSQSETATPQEIEVLDHSSSKERLSVPQEQGAFVPDAEVVEEEEEMAATEGSPVFTGPPVKTLDPASVVIPPHFDQEAAKRMLQMADELSKKARPRPETDWYADTPTYREQPGQRLAEYYEKWHSEEENTDSSEQGREWLLEQFSQHDVPTDDVEVSCRETLCRIRITVPGKGGMDALGRFPTDNRRLIIGDPEIVHDQVVLAVYYPLEDGQLRLED